MICVTDELWVLLIYSPIVLFVICLDSNKVLSYFIKRNKELLLQKLVDGYLIPESQSSITA